MAQPAGRDDWRFETISVHGGYSPDPTTKAVAVPLYQTVAYAFDNAQHGADLFDLKVPGNIYTRIMNPTQDVLEQRLAALEGGIAALALASGQAAVTYSILTITEAGDNIVASSALYGGTYNLFAHTLPQYGIESRFADYRQPATFEALIDSKTKAVFVESLGNPQGNITDLERIAAIAHRHGVPLIVDNTVPTPYLCRPFKHGADVVVHSLTKYLGGHGTSLGGAIVDSGKFPWAEHKQRFRRLNEPDPSYHGVVYTDALGPAAYIGRARVVPLRNTGAAISPFNAWLILQGIETLSLRIDRISDSALTIARHLQQHDRVAWTNYAGLEDHPDHALLGHYLSGKASGILTFGLKGAPGEGRERGGRFGGHRTIVNRPRAHQGPACRFGSCSRSGLTAFESRPNAAACDAVMCGGKGGTFGSVFTSKTTGRSLARASCHAVFNASGESTKMPLRPNISANCE
jgi:O-acetylhomoserine (thiol)-lyase